MILEKVDQFDPEAKKQKIIIMGGGPAGLGAGYVLAQNGVPSTVYEGSNVVGGISRTVKHRVGKDVFYFDLGGHRWFTKDDNLDAMIVRLMRDEFIQVNRTSFILFRGKKLDYPPKILNALSVLGSWTSFLVMANFGFTKIKNIFRPKQDRTFQDWIVNRFGYKLFEVYFKSYTEKVWGIPCTQIGAEWAAQRIKGMSMRAAIKNALFKKAKDRPKTLIEKFKFPKHGIGRISERMQEEINKVGSVVLGEKVVEINHKGSRVTSIVIEDKEGKRKEVFGDQFVSSIPLTQLVKILKPKASKEILEAVKKLRYRDMITVNLLVNKPRLTQDTWIYIHDPSFKLGRVHEPRNWSKEMSPKGESSLVVEYWCFIGDEIWNMPEKDLIELTLKDVSDRLKFFDRNQLIDTVIIRTPKAYPEYKIGYREPLQKIKKYVSSFKNLQTIGRYGTYKYNNLDHSILTGVYAARNILGEHHDIEEVNADKEYHEIKDQKG